MRADALLAGLLVLAVLEVAGSSSDIPSEQRALPSPSPASDDHDHSSSLSLSWSWGGSWGSSGWGSWGSSGWGSSHEGHNHSAWGSSFSRSSGAGSGSGSGHPGHGHADNGASPTPAPSQGPPATTPAPSPGTPAPVISVVAGPQKGRITNPVVGLKISISYTAPSTIASLGSKVLYTVDGSVPTCDIGELYVGPISLCGDETAQTMVKAVECEFDGTNWIVASMATKSFNIMPYQPKAPLEPNFDVDPSSGVACELAGSSAVCSVKDGGKDLKLSFQKLDFICNDTSYTTSETCTAAGMQWGPIPQCPASHDETVRPCLDVYYTTNGEDPSNPATQTRKLLPDSGIAQIPVQSAASFQFRAAAVRLRRPAVAACKCCCQGSTCSVAGPIKTTSFTFSSTPPTNSESGNTNPVRGPLQGSPDITFTLPSDKFDSFFQGIVDYNRQWRQDVSNVLGLLDGNKPDQAYLRIQGQCTCQVEKSDAPCTVDNTGASQNICFYKDSRRTPACRVTFFIKTIGKCSLESASRNIACMDNSDCGVNSQCVPTPYSWMLAYGDLQDKEDTVMRKLAQLGVEGVDLQAVVDVSAARHAANAESFSSAAIAGMLLVLLGLCFVCVAKRHSIKYYLKNWRRWSLSKCWKYRKEIPRHVRDFRMQERLARHAQFQRFTEGGTPRRTDFSEERGDVSRNESERSFDKEGDEKDYIESESTLFATKIKQPQKAIVTPLSDLFGAAAAITTSTPAQPVQTFVLEMEDADPSRNGVEHSFGAKGEGGGDEWGAFEETHEEDKKTFKRHELEPAGPICISMEFDPSMLATSYRTSTLVQNLIFSNSGDKLVTGFVCKAAVPKHMQVQITPPSSTEIAPLLGAEVIQTLRLSGVEKGKALKVRLRVEYVDHDGKDVVHTIDANLAELV